MTYRRIKTAGAIDEYSVLEIEYILPNNPNSDLRNSFTSLNPDVDYDEYKTRLGNLTLLEKPINIVAGNDFFLQKSDVYRKSKYYLTSSIAELTVVGNNTSINRMNQKLKSFTEWSAASIDERQVMLSRLVTEIWKIEVFR